jgi:hypothetical protein
MVWQTACFLALCCRQPSTRTPKFFFFEHAFSLLASSYPMPSSRYCLHIDNVNAQVRIYAILPCPRDKFVLSGLLLLFIMLLLMNVTQRTGAQGVVLECEAYGKVGRPPPHLHRFSVVTRYQVLSCKVRGTRALVEFKHRWTSPAFPSSPPSRCFSGDATKALDKLDGRFVGAASLVETAHTASVTCKLLQFVDLFWSSTRFTSHYSHRAFVVGIRLPQLPRCLLTPARSKHASLAHHRIFSLFFSLVTLHSMQTSPNGVWILPSKRTSRSLA